MTTTVNSEPEIKEEPPFIRLACRTFADDGYEDMAYMVVDMTLVYAQELLSKIGLAEVFATDTSFYRVSYYDYTHDCYGGIDALLEDLPADQFNESWDDLLNDGAWIELPLTLNLGEATRIDSQTLHIGKSDVLWKAYPKYGDGQVESRTLAKTTIAELAVRLANLHALAEIKNTEKQRTRVIDLNESRKT